MKELKDYITNIPDFPQKGIIFRDVTSLLQSGKGFSTAVDKMLGQLDDASSPEPQSLRNMTLSTARQRSRYTPIP